MAYNYPYGNGQQLNLDWFLAEWKNLLAAWEAEKNGIEGALQAEIDRAEAALADVLTARDAAAQSAANALESKNAAAQSASDASGYLATVRADANAAHDAAQNAAQSESNAADSAQTALASKNTAANSERNAAQSEANANSSKNAAAQSAEDASASKDAAAQSAADADASKSAAAQSVEDAENAAASVEASAQQITTNASDISNLKESLSYSAIPRMIQPYAFMKKGVTSHGNRKYTVDRNFLRMQGTATSTSYSNVYISGNGNVHAGSGTSQALIDGLRDEDFITIPKPITGTLIFMCSYDKVPGNSANIAGGGQIHFYTKAGDGSITRKTIDPTANPCGYNITANFPEAIENGNLAISWKNYIINTTVDISAVFELVNIFQSFYTPANVLALALENG